MLKKLFSILKLHDDDEYDLQKQKFNEVSYKMIEGIKGLAETTVKEVMVPRTDVEFLSMQFSISEMLRKIVSSTHSRFPVYDDTIDNIVGIIYVKDLLKHFVHNENRAQLMKEINIKNIVRPAYFVPETQRIDTLLHEMKRIKTHIGIVLDEYSGVNGIVCMEDILEEIIGDIQDEFDNEVEEVVHLSENVLLCDARLNIEEAQELLGFSVDSEDYDTLGGFVFNLFGKIPQQYETITYLGMRFIVYEVDGYKIKRIKIERLNDVGDVYENI